MRHKQKQSKTFRVNKMYEPNRLAQKHLERVYEQLIPKQVYILQPQLKTIKSANTCDDHNVKEYLG